MCTLHLCYQVYDATPVLFAANRDEHLSRAWRAPAVLSRFPPVFGPRDLVAGGTWLGVNAAGVLVSLANHEGTLARGGGMCSRGTIVLEALRHESADAARHFAEWVAPACKSYTLLIADPAKAFVVDHSPEGTQTYRLQPGCHVITNARFRDPLDQKAARSLRRIKRRVSGSAEPAAEDWFAFLGDHQPAAEGFTPLCIHPPQGGEFGTSSSSLVRIAADGRVRSFHFTEGTPCTAPVVEATPDLAWPADAGETRQGI